MSPDWNFTHRYNLNMMLKRNFTHVQWMIFIFLRASYNCEKHNNNNRNDEDDDISIRTRRGHNTGSNQLFTKKRLLFILPLYCFRIKCKQAVCLMFAAHKGTDNKKMIFHPIYTLIYRIHFNDLFLFIFFYSWIFLCTIVCVYVCVRVHKYIVTHNTYIIYLYNILMSTHK